MKCEKFVVNAVGRRVPTIVNGESVVPFMGLRKYRPTGRKYAPIIPTCIDYPDDGNKVVSSLAEA
jgi:citrate lyase subunit alpha/citrate CoA-transferase